MAEPARRLGRGLATMLGQAPQREDAGVGDSTGTLKHILTASITANPRQPRSGIDPGSLAELTASIARQGVLQPLLVRALDEAGRRYELIAGERRWRAAREAGLSTVPCLVQPLSDQSAAVAALVENLQREDLPPLDEAEGYRRMLEEFGLTQEGLAQAVGKSRSHVANTIRLLAVPGKVREALHAGLVSAGHARALLGHANPEAALALVLEGGLSVRATEALVADSEHGQLRRTAGREPPRLGEISARATDVETASIERVLTERLGLAVRLRDQGGRGRLVIGYTHGRPTRRADSSACARLSARLHGHRFVHLIGSGMARSERTHRCGADEVSRHPCSLCHSLGEPERGRIPLQCRPRTTARKTEYEPTLGGSGRSLPAHRQARCPRRDPAGPACPPCRRPRPARARSRPPIRQVGLRLPHQLHLPRPTSNAAARPTLASDCPVASAHATSASAASAVAVTASDRSEPSNAVRPAARSGVQSTSHPSGASPTTRAKLERANREPKPSSSRAASGVPSRRSTTRCEPLVCLRDPDHPASPAERTRPQMLLQRRPFAGDERGDSERVVHPAKLRPDQASRGITHQGLVLAVQRRD